MNIDYTISDRNFCWKEQMHTSQAIRDNVTKSGNNPTAAGHFGKDRRLEHISLNLYWLTMEDDIRAYCSKCEI